MAKLKYTWANGEEQIRTHALNNGFHSDIELITAFEFINSADNNLEELGRLLHRYRDCYAHSRLEDFDNLGNPIVLLDSIKMYGKPISSYWDKTRAILGYVYFGTIAHTFEHKDPDDLRPDQIAERPNWYVDYVKNLALIISLKFDLPVDLYHSFKRKGIIKFEHLAYYAQTNDVSLIGIIDFETAKWLYGKSSKQQDYFSFLIPFARGKFGVENLRTHKTHIENTIQYLKNQSVNYSYLEYFDSNKSYLGVKFNVKDKNE